jgi:putative membrane protein
LPDPDRPLPYCGAPPAPADWLAQWNADPALLLALAGAAAGLLFAAPRAAGRRCAAVAWLLCVLLFVSPLCALASALFSVRALHHVVLVAAVAPLLAAAFPPARAPAAAPAFVIATGILWAWHLPPAYALAMADPSVYWLMQGSLAGSALCVWQAVLSPRAAPLPALLTIGASIGQMGLLGSLLTFAPEPLYSQHFVAPLAWGLTPLEDQQLAGLSMWVPAMLPYLLLAGVVLRRLRSRPDGLLS